MDQNKLRKYVRSGIAIFCVLSAGAFIALGVEIPKWWEAAVLLIIGFYYGDQTSSRGK